MMNVLNAAPLSNAAASRELAAAPVDGPAAEPGGFAAMLEQAAASPTPSTAKTAPSANAAPRSPRAPGDVDEPPAQDPPSEPALDLDDPLHADTQPTSLPADASLGLPGLVASLAGAAPASLVGAAPKAEGQDLALAAAIEGPPVATQAANGPAIASAAVALTERGAFVLSPGREPLPAAGDTTVASIAAGGASAARGAAATEAMAPLAAARTATPAAPGAGAGDAALAPAAAAEREPNGTEASAAIADATGTVAAADAAPSPMPSSAAQGVPAAEVHPTNAPAGSAAAGPAAPIEARIDAPLGGETFGPALGLQVSVLARDGLQHARLHLNPAEMGPITVRIALDGAQARVDFQAEAAATRQVIEASLPALASALRESGLTLSGGGVFQQSPDHPSQRGQAHRSDGGPAGAGHEPPRARAPAEVRSLPMRRGLVDLVA